VAVGEANGNVLEACGAKQLEVRRHSRAAVVTHAIDGGHPLLRGRAERRWGRASSRPRPPAAQSGFSSRVELQHRVRIALQDLADAVAAPGLLLAPDDKRLTRAHVEDRDHGAAAQRVGSTDLGQAIHAAPARPQPEDPLSARHLAQLELDRVTQLRVGILDAALIAAAPRMKNAVT